MSEQQQYVVVQRRSPTPYLLLILIATNVLSIFIAFNYYSRVTELERAIRQLDASVRILNNNVNQIQRSLAPVSVAFDYYVKISMARMISEMYGIPLEEALRMIEAYYNRTGYP